jgi:hypothetical protein
MADKMSAEEIKQVIRDFAIGNDYGDTDDGIEEVILDCAEDVHTRIGSEHRWYFKTFEISRLGDLTFGFEFVKMKGEDGDWRDVLNGFPFDTLCEVEQVEIKKTVWRKK